MRGRRKWTGMKAFGAESPVFVVRVGPVTDEGCACHAAVMDDGSIEVEEKPDAEAMRDALFHEICHKALERLTGDMGAEIFGQGTPEERYKREELFISYFSPHLFAILRGNGWLRIPKPPKLA